MTDRVNSFVVHTKTMREDDALDVAHAVVKLVREHDPRLAEYLCCVQRGEVKVPWSETDAGRGCTSEDDY